MFQFKQNYLKVLFACFLFKTFSKCGGSKKKKLITVLFLRVYLLLTQHSRLVFVKSQPSSLFYQFLNDFWVLRAIMVTEPVVYLSCVNQGVLHTWLNFHFNIRGYIEHLMQFAVTRNICLVIVNGSEILLGSQLNYLSVLKRLGFFQKKRGWTKSGQIL